MNTQLHQDLRAKQRSRRTWRGIRPLAILWFTFPGVVLAAGQTANQSARDIPLAYDVDVVVVGGPSAGVAAAVAAAKQGAKVFLAAPRPYLGEDLCATYFPWVTWLDSYIIALGRTRDPRALEPLLEKLALLGQGSGSRVSHYRALALAFEALGDGAAAKPLGEAMQRLGIRGMAVTDTAGLTAQDRSKSGQSNLTLARVLYRLGDHEGIGKAILEQYARDIRGHYARHAQAVLKEGPLLRP